MDDQSQMQGIKRPRDVGYNKIDALGHCYSKGHAPKADDLMHFSLQE
jgi:hypothetical protein